MFVIDAFDRQIVIKTNVNLFIKVNAALNVLFQTYSVVSEHTKSAPKAEEPPVPVKTVTQVSTTSNASSSGTVSPGPVTIDGIHFPASATELRAQMAAKKSRDPRLSSQVSMAEKYKLFERM